MPRLSILAIAAVAAIGFTALATTDADARFGGGGGGGMSRGGGGHAGGFSRAVYHPGNNVAMRGPRTINRPVMNRPGNGPKIGHLHQKHPHIHHRRHIPHWAWHWCRHHHYHNWCRGWGIGVYTQLDPVVVSDAPRYVTPAAAVCTTDCDYLLNDGTGCYMAKRKFSTPQGDELRCVKICDEPEVK